MADTDADIDAAAPFAPEFEPALRRMFEQRMPFNQWLGLRISALHADGVELHIDMRPEMVGHFGQQRLHGGVMSATLDAVAGLAVMAAIGARHRDEPPAALMGRFAKLGTIDLRVDYMRTAIGERFIARGNVLRLGSRVATTRMEFLGIDGALIAAGAAAYIVS